MVLWLSQKKVDWIMLQLNFTKKSFQPNHFFDRLRDVHVFGFSQRYQSCCLGDKISFRHENISLEWSPFIEITYIV